jgi:hypothetical protein
VRPLAPTARALLHRRAAGHQVSLATAVALVRHCCCHRVPEPIRQADIRSRAAIRERKQVGCPAVHLLEFILP